VISVLKELQLRTRLLPKEARDAVTALHEKLKEAKRPTLRRPGPARRGMYREGGGFVLLWNAALC
jgi:hypothetical protein